MIYVLMGVAGCGKTEIGKALAGRLKLPFFDGDDFHPPGNIKKMKAGISLCDEDRMPWLEILSGKIALWDKNGGACLACSALKESYRLKLKENLQGGLLYIYLEGSRELILGRMQKRAGHFMPPGLLDSQFEALEIPEEALTVHIAPPIDEIVENIINKLPSGAAGNG